MRIAVDVTAMPAQRVGAGNYILNLTRALVRVEPASEFVVFAQPNDVSSFSAGLSNCRVIPSASNSRLQRILWEQTVLPRRIKSASIDVLHSPHYTIPVAVGCASVVTFHDMTFFLYPELHQFYKRIFFRAMIRLSARRADAIIADSESSRQDILRILKVDPQKVFAVPLGVAPHYRPPDDAEAIAAIRTKYHLPQKTILYVGVLEPRKNLTVLVQGFKALVDRGLPHTLVIVGRRGWMYAELFKTIKRLDLAERVIFTGYVPEPELPLIYSAADLFVYPSLYEGFGLPILEAMACGVPVVTSNVSSMPEIAGDAGVLIDPRQVDALADAMGRVLTNRARHDELRRRGLERAKFFSWEKTARETLAVYTRVVPSP